MWLQGIYVTVMHYVVMATYPYTVTSKDEVKVMKKDLKPDHEDSKYFKGEPDIDSV